MKKGKKPAWLTEKDVYNLTVIEEALSVNDEETVSQACLRFGVGCIPDEDLLIPAQKALSAMSEYNVHLDENSFSSWYQGLIDDEEIFRLDKNMLEAVREARVIYDEKIAEWAAEGVVDADFETDYAFWGIIGLVIVMVSSELDERYEQLRNDAFYKDPMFGKYRIIALEDADGFTLNSFPNNRSYNRFDVEELQLYVMDRYDWIDRHGEICSVYQEVKNVVYDNPNRKLSDTKAELEGLAKSSSEKKFQYAILYTCAVIEYWLKK